MCAVGPLLWSLLPGPLPGRHVSPFYFLLFYRRLWLTCCLVGCELCVACVCVCRLLLAQVAFCFLAQVCPWKGLGAMDRRNVDDMRRAELMKYAADVLGVETRKMGSGGKKNLWQS